MKTIISTLAIGLVFLSSCKSVKEPEYREINNIRIIDVGLLQTTAGLDMIYYNPNGFGVQLDEARGDVYIDNAYFGRFDLEEKVDVGRKSEFVVPAVIKVDMIGAVKNQLGLLKKKEAMIRIEGTARVKKGGMGMNVPIKYEGMQNIERFRTLVSK